MAPRALPHYSSTQVIAVVPELPETGATDFVWTTCAFAGWDVSHGTAKRSKYPDRLKVQRAVGYLLALMEDSKRELGRISCGGIQDFME